MTSHPSPFYRQRQSTKTLDPNNDTAKFLYTILKQLDLKNIDWNEVASSLDITNGHAARMRWSRFKAQIEGLDNSYSRRATKSNGVKKSRGSSKKRKASYDQAQMYGMTATGSNDMKMENMTHGNGRFSVDARHERLKEEPTEKTTRVNGVTIHHPTMTTIVASQPSSRASYFTPQRSESGQNAYPSSDVQYSSNRMHDQQRRPAYGYTGQQTSNTWPHQYSDANYAYPMYSSENAQSSYHAAANMYNNQHQYGSTYGSPYPQRYNYGQRYPAYQAQSSQSYALGQFHGQSSGNTITPPTPSINNMQRPHNLPELQPQQTVQQNSPVPEQRLPLTVDMQSQARAVDLASQASYPWPYSEDTLPNFTEQEDAKPKQAPVANKASNSRISEFDLAHHDNQPVRPDVMPLEHARQSATQSDDSNQGVSTGREQSGGCENTERVVNTATVTAAAVNDPTKTTDSKTQQVSLVDSSHDLVIKDEPDV